MICSALQYSISRETSTNPACQKCFTGIGIAVDLLAAITFLIIGTLCLRQVIATTPAVTYGLIVAGPLLLASQLLSLFAIRIFHASVNKYDTSISLFSDFDT